MVRLEAKSVAKPWGRRDLAGLFGASAQSEEPIGEIWFEAPFPVPLLVKFLFTSEPLSIQVHPDDEAARGMGLGCGKDEAWAILEADPDAVIGLGLREEASLDRLRRAATDGSIEGLVDWRPVAAGDVFYSPAGTIHALGAGLKLVEVQQNLDLTFRLYDFGRPRPLQLDEALAAAKPALHPEAATPIPIGPGRMIAAQGPAFTFERWSGPATIAMKQVAGGPVWIVPLGGEVRAGREILDFGEVWLSQGEEEISLAEGGSALAAYLPAH